MEHFSIFDKMFYFSHFRHIMMKMSGLERKYLVRLDNCQLDDRLLWRWHYTVPPKRIIEKWGRLLVSTVSVMFSSFHSQVPLMPFALPFHSVFVWLSHLFSLMVNLFERSFGIRCCMWYPLCCTYPLLVAHNEHRTKYPLPIVSF